MGCTTNLPSDGISEPEITICNSPTTTRFSESLQNGVHEHTAIMTGRLFGIHRPKGSEDLSLQNMEFSFAPAHKARTKPSACMQPEAQSSGKPVDINNPSSTLVVSNQPNHEPNPVLRRAPDESLQRTNSHSLAPPSVPESLLVNASSGENTTSAAETGGEKTQANTTKLTSLSTSTISDGNVSSKPHNHGQPDTNVDGKNADAEPDKASKDRDTSLKSVGSPTRLISRESMRKAAARNSFAPLNSCNKVSKVDQVHKRPTTTPRIMPLSSKGPTEDDLLMLLMRRSRQRADVNAQLSACQQALRENEIELSKHKLASGQQVKQVEKKFIRSKHRNLAMREELDEFKHRFEKLRRWASEVTTQNAELRVSGDQLRIELHDLREQNSDISLSMRDVRVNFLKASERLDAALTEVPGMKADLVDMSSKLCHNQRLLVTTQAEKGQEMQRNTEYTKHIRLLECSQQLLAKGIVDCRTILSENMINLVQRLDKVSEASPAAGLEDCVQMLRTLVQRPSWDSTEMQSVSQNLQDLEKSVTNVATTLTSATDLDQSSRSELLENLKALEHQIGTLQPDLGFMADMKIGNAELQERVRGAKEIQEILENDKRKAVSREEALLKSNSQLIGKFESAKNAKEASSSLLNESQKSTISELTIKYGRCNAELKKTKIEAESQRLSITALSADVSLYKDSYEFDTVLLQNEYEEKLASMHSVNQILEEELVTAHQVELAMKDKDLSDARAELKTEKVLRDLTIKDLHCVRQSRDHVTGELEVVHAAVADQSLEIAKLRALLKDSRDRLEIAQSLAIQVPGLETAAKEKDQELMALKEEAIVADGLRTNVAELKQRYAISDQRLLQTQEQLSKAEQVYQDVESLRNEIEDHISHRNDLQEKLNKAQQDASRAISLAQLIDSKNSEIVQLQNKLETAKHEFCRFNAIQQQNEALCQNVADLQIQLDQSRLDAAKVVTLQSKIHRRDQSITALRKSANDMQNLFNDIEAARKESQDKEMELVSLRERVADIERDSQQLNPIQEEFAGSNFDNMFSMEPVLSIPSQMRHDRQRPLSEANQCGVEVQATPENSVPLKHSPKLRRVANRHGRLNLPPNFGPTGETQDLVCNMRPRSSMGTDMVPNSQVDQLTHYVDGSLPVGSPRSTSPLSDVPESLEADELTIHRHAPDITSSIDMAKTSILGATDSRLPDLEHMKQLGATDRPNTSCSEMLLHSSDPSNREEQSPDGIDFSNSTDATVPTRAGSKYLHRELQARQSTPFTEDSQTLDRYLTTTSPVSVLKEKIQPNSAAKRRIDIAEPQIEPSHRGKRLRRTALNASSQQSNDSSTTQRMTIDGSEFDLPSEGNSNLASGKKTSASVTTTSSSHLRNGKKSKSSKRKSRSDRYAARFSQNDDDI